MSAPSTVPGNANPDEGKSLLEDMEKGAGSPVASSKKPLERNFKWEKSQRRKVCVCGVLMWPIKKIMGLVMFVLLLSLWFVWHILYPFCWVLCCCFCRKLGIPTAEQAYPKDSYRPFGSPAHPLRKGDRPYRIAIIGGGWSGLASAKHLMDKGVDVTIFEAGSRLGGTWNPDFAYHGLHIHTPMWVVEGDEAPYHIEEKRNTCLSAPELFDYLTAYANKFGLEKVLKLNSRVVRVCYESKTDLSQVEVRGPNGELEMVGNFDAVVYTSFNPTPHRPTWPKQDEFKGRVLHTAECQTPVFEEIQNSNAKVVVVGGGKSSLDMLLNFNKTGNKNVTWLRRSAYMFIHMHTICHDKSLYAMVRAFFTIGALAVALMWPPLCALLLLCFNAAVVPRGFTLDIARFHFGFLSPDFIKAANETDLVKSEIVNFTPTGVKLKNGKDLACDYVICATGYRTGVSNIVYERDEQTVTFQPVESLFEGVVSPVMPRLMFAHTNVYVFGMKRATVFADHVMSLLVRFPDASRMKNSFVNSRACNMNAGLNFDNTRPLTIVFLHTYLVLLGAGILSIPALLSNLLPLFLLCRLRPLQLKHPRTPAPPVVV